MSDSANQPLADSTSPSGASRRSVRRRRNLLIAAVVIVVAVVVAVVIIVVAATSREGSIRGCDRAIPGAVALPRICV